MTAEEGFIPPDYQRIRFVDNMEALINEPFGTANAIVLRRRLTGDFNAMAQTVNKRRLGLRTIKAIYKDADLAASFPHELSQVRADLDAMKALFGQNAEDFFALSLRTSGDVLWGRNAAPEKFHTDSATSADYGRFLCCYTGLTTEWIRNEDAISIAKGGFVMREGATVYRFGVGDIWRMASRQRGDNDAVREGGYFVHRTPISENERKKGDPPRMLMVAG